LVYHGCGQVDAGDMLRQFGKHECEPPNAALRRQPQRALEVIDFVGSGFIAPARAYS